MEILMKLKCPPTSARSPHSYKVSDRLNAAPAACLDCCNGSPHTHTHPDMYANSPRCCSTGSCCTAPFPACCNGGGVGVGIGISESLNFTPQQNFSEETEIHYEYQEPEENFVSIDDAKIKGFLMKIGQEQQRVQKIQEPKMVPEKAPTLAPAKPQLVYEIIDLDDEEEREKLKRIKNQAENEVHNRLNRYVEQNTQPQKPTKTKVRSKQSPQQRKTTPTRQSPDISLVPKETENVQRDKKNSKKSSPFRIIASIDLLDSSSSDESGAEEPSINADQLSDNEEHQNITAKDEINENDADADDDDEDLPLAAAAVSCELECDDQEDETLLTRKYRKKSNYNEIENDNNNNTNNPDNDDGIVVLGSDEEYIDEHEEGREVRWDELALEFCYGKSNRTVYECCICGKKVQSNYNLRRHMMIHTGECTFVFK